MTHTISVERSSQILFFLFFFFSPTKHSSGQRWKRKWNVSRRSFLVTQQQLNNNITHLCARNFYCKQNNGLLSNQSAAVGLGTFLKQIFIWKENAERSAWYLKQPCRQQQLQLPSDGVILMMKNRTILFSRSPWQRHFSRPSWCTTKSKSRSGNVWSINDFQIMRRWNNQTQTKFSPPKSTFFFEFHSRRILTNNFWLVYPILSSG